MALKHFLPQEQTPVLFAFKEELADDLLTCMLEGISDAKSARTSLYPFRMMLENLSELNGMSMNYDEMDIFSTYMSKHGRRMRSKQYNDIWCANKSSNQPAFLDKPKLSSTPKQSIAYHNSHNFFNNAYRAYMNAHARSCAMSLQHFSIMFDEDASNEYQNRFITLVRCALNKEHIVQALVPPSKRHECRDQQLHDKYLSEYCMESMLNVYRKCIDIPYTTSEWYKTDPWFNELKADVLGCTTTELIIHKLAPFMYHDESGPARKFKRNIAAVKSTMEMWYPVISELFYLSTAGGDECCIAENLPTDIKSIAACNQLNDIMRKAYGIYHHDCDADDTSDQAYTMFEQLKQTSCEWSGHTDTMFWPTMQDNLDTFNKVFWGQTESKYKIEHTTEFRKYYRESNYASRDNVPSGSLWGSCMRHESTNECIEFYEAAGAELLIMKDEYGKILSRAVLWPSVRIIPHTTRDRSREKEPEVGMFLDRVYYTHDWIVHSYIKLAKQKGWYYKQEQNYSSQRKIVTPKGTRKPANVQVMLPDAMKPYMYKMPYMDTFEWVDIKNKVLLNWKPTSESCYCYNTGNVVRPKQVDVDGYEEKQWVLDMTKFPSGKDTLDYPRNRDLWQMRGTSQRPTSWYDRFSSDTSRRASSAKFTKRWGFLANYRDVISSRNKEHRNQRKIMTIPTGLSYFCSYNDAWFDISTKVKGGFYDGYECVVSDQKFQKAVSIDNMLTYDDYKLNSGQFVKVRYNSSRDVIVPKLGADYCPGFKRLVTHTNMRSGSRYLIDGVVSMCCKHFTQSQQILNSDTFVSLKRQGKTNLEVLQQEFSSDNLNTAWVWCEFTGCYIGLEHAVFVSGFGITSTELLGAHGESVMRKYEELTSRIKKSSDKKLVSKLKRSNVAEEYREFI